MRRVPGLLLYPSLAPDVDVNSVSKFGESFVDIECVKREFSNFYLRDSKFRAFLHRIFFLFASNVFIHDVLYKPDLRHDQFVHPCQLLGYKETSGSTWKRKTGENSTD